MDAHCRPQSALLLDGAVEDSHIGRVESFRADMAPVVARLGLSPHIVSGLESEPINRTGQAPHDGHYAPRFDADLAALVFERYRQDFERFGYPADSWRQPIRRSEEHTSELQSLMRISYAVFCLKKKKT